MKHLKIENFGPLKLADIEIGKFNLIIGFQSSGKSCILKTACFCSWVEKRILLSQSARDFTVGNSFKKTLERYYTFDGYFKHNTKIEYGRKKGGITNVKKSPTSLRSGTLLRRSQIGGRRRLPTTTFSIL